MRLAFFNFADRIAWSLSGDAPALFPIAGTNDWSIVNPLLYSQLPIIAQKTDPALEIAAGQNLLLNSEIVFAQANERPDSAEDTEDLVHLVADLLVRLRHVTGQATLPSLESLLAHGYTKIVELPQLTFNSWSFLSRSYVQEYILTTAITAERIRAAAGLQPNFKPPTHEVLLLDAIRSFRGNDFSRAILHATISAEVAFGSVIDEAYERMRGGQVDERFRVIVVGDAGKAAVREDPIFKRLRDRSNFKTLLHELSLYVLGRSLLAENKTLFDDAKRLYSTRNQLVHSGELDESDSKPSYPLDSNGGMAALKTVIALFSWLGVRDDFPLPDGKFVPCD